MFSQAERAGIAAVATIAPAILLAEGARTMLASGEAPIATPSFVLLVAMLVAGGVNTVVLAVDEQQPFWAWLAGPFFMALALGVGLGAWTDAGLVLGCGVVQGQLQRVVMRAFPESLDGILWKRPVPTLLVGLVVFAAAVGLVFFGLRMLAAA